MGPNGPFGFFAQTDPCIYRPKSKLELVAENVNLSLAYYDAVLVVDR